MIASADQGIHRVHTKNGVLVLSGWWVDPQFGLLEYIAGYFSAAQDTLLEQSKSPAMTVPETSASLRYCISKDTE